MQKNYANNKVLHHHRSLTISFRQLFDFPSSLLINVSGKGVDWVLYVQDEDPEYSEYLCEPAVSIEFLESKPEYRSWFDGLISLEVKERLMQYPEIGFTLLWHISSFRPAFDLFVSSPTLLWLLLYYAKKGGFSKTTVFELICGKQVEILKACNISNKPAAVTLLRNLKFETYYIGTDLKRVLSLISHPNLEKLNHHKNLDFTLAAIVTRFPELIGGKIIYDYKPESWAVSTKNLIKDSYFMINRFEDARSSLLTRLKSCSSHIEIEAFHDDLIEKLNKKLDYGVLISSFGLPPLKGSADIQPIRDTADLIHEGRIMRHCVASYEDPILNGEYYVYRVLKPQRATLGLILDKSQRMQPKLDQLLLKSNRPVSYETREHVERWLQHNIVKPVYEE